MSKFKVLVLILPLVISCTKATRSGSSGMASYYVARIPPADIPSQTTSVVKGWSGFPNQKTFYFKTCLWNMLQNQSIIGHAFSITGPDQPKTNPEQPKTDPYGCLNWSEVIDFDPLAQPTFLQIERTFVPHGLHRGNRTVSFAINPWSHFNGGEADVVDRTISSLAVARIEPFKKEALLSKNSKHNVPMSIETVSYDTLSVNDSLSKSVVDISFIPSYVLTSMTGETQPPTPFLEGQFRVKPYLIHKSLGGSSEMMWQDVSPQIAEVKSGSMASVQFRDVRFARDLESTGTYQLLLEVEPVNGPAGLSNFRQVYLLGDMKNAKGGSSFKRDPSAHIADLNQVQIESYKSEIAPPAETTTAKAIRLGKTKIDVFEVGNDFGDRRKLQINIAAPVVDRDFKPLRPDLPFIVEFEPLGDGPKLEFKKSEVKTELGGILYLRSEILHSNFYKQQKKIPYILRAHYQTQDQKETAMDSLTAERVICLNPSAQGAFDTDQVYFTNGQCPNQPDADEKPTLKLTDLMWKLSPHPALYSVDQNLTLNSKMFMTVSLAPDIYRYDGPDRKQAKAEGLVNGYYLLTVMTLFNDTVNNRADQILTSTQGVVKSEGGKIEAEIELLVNSNNALPLMTQPNYVAVQVSQIDQSDLRFDAQKHAKNFRVLDSTETDLVSVPSIFEISPDGSGAPVKDRNNLNKDQKYLSDIYNELDHKPLWERHLVWAKGTQKYSSQPKTDQEIASSWKEFGNKLKTKTFEFSSQGDLDQFLKESIPPREYGPSFRGIAQSDAIETFKCLDQANWGFKDSVPTCGKIKHVFKAARRLCPLFESEFICSRSPFEYLKAETKIFAYDVDQNVPSEDVYMGGIPTNIGVNNMFGIGSYFGSDVGQSNTSTGALSLGANQLGAAGFNAHLYPGGMAAIGLASVSTTRSESAFMIDFSRNYRENMSYMGNTAALKIEITDAMIHLKKSRTCYLLRSPKMVHETEGGFLFCEQPKTAPEGHPDKALERYVSVYNIPASGAMVSPYDLKNRFMVHFRGERDYYKFMKLFANDLKGYQIGGVPTPVSDMLMRCVYPEVKAQLPMVDGIISSTFPGVNVYSRIANRGADRNFNSWLGDVPNIVNVFNPLESFGTKRVTNTNDMNSEVIEDLPKYSKAHYLCPRR